ncbi:MAG: SUMF1/EgtB/PvdO family nonheme iron enzyme, partial [Deltaproteobacteria bacterium]|nr:SUMF1/EgtB/PvdO family nonheme iron enzyme [Deltaproteobacteria bacterium]
SDAGWTLKLQPSTQLYVARQGERIHYLDRATHADEDWQRMPVLGVSLEDLRAYAQWLDTTGRVPHARPCTELEWERAARGADDREFPSGDALAAADADFDETYGKQPRAFGPDEVGQHAGSRSPFGIDDMAGNAFEWAADPISADAAAIRGGTFYYGALTARSTNRNTLEPGLRSVQVGARVCASPTK